MITVGPLVLGRKVHGRKRNQYALCRLSTDERDQRGLAELHEFMANLEEYYMPDSTPDKAAYLFEFKDGIPVYHLSAPKRKIALRMHAVEKSEEEIDQLCRWDKELSNGIRTDQ